MPPSAAQPQPPWAMVRWTKSRKRARAVHTTAPLPLDAPPIIPACSSDAEQDLERQGVCRVQASCSAPRVRSHVERDEELHVPCALVPLDMTPHVAMLVYELACMRRAAWEQRYAFLLDAQGSSDEAPEEMLEEEEQSPIQSHLPGLVVSLCQCARSGVCASSRVHLPRMNRPMQTRRVGVTSPLQEFGLRVRHAPFKLQWLPPALLEAACAEIKSLCVDDDIVRQNGLNGPWVRLCETEHPSCSRVRMSLCQDGYLSLYPNSTNQQPGTECSRHMTPVLFKLIACLAACFQDDMPAAFRGMVPDLLSVQYFRGRANMGWHTDSRPDSRRQDQVVAQQPGSPVLSVNLFDDFLFCTVPIQDGDSVDKKMQLRHSEEQAILLKHGDAMMWPHADDISHKHRVVPPPGKHIELRVSVVCRFSNDAVSKRRFAPEFPYRVMEGPPHA
jgi:hypothetical protein